MQELEDIELKSGQWIEYFSDVYSFNDSKWDADVSAYREYPNDAVLLPSQLTRDSGSCGAFSCNISYSRPLAGSPAISDEDEL